MTHLVDLPDGPGIYVICSDTAPGWRTLHYIGQSVNIARRVRQHGTKDGAKQLWHATMRGIAFRVTAVLSVPDGYTLAQYERLLKNRRHHARLCPACRERIRAAKAS